jgi:hypothetical protein
MKIIQLLFLSATLVFKPMFAWDCSRECDDYEQCVKEQNRNRELGIFEPHAVDQDDKETDAASCHFHSTLVKSAWKYHVSKQYFS